MLAVACALGTMACYGLANYLGPLQTRRYGLGGVLLVSQGTSLVLSIVLVLVLTPAVPDGTAILFAAGAGLANALAIGAFYEAAATGAISIAAPVGATGAAVPVVVGLLTGERPDVVQLVGMPLAMIGVVLVARPDTGGERRTPAALRSLLLAIASAVAFGTFLTLFAKASEDGVAWAVLVSRTGVVALITAAVLGSRQALRVPPSALPRVMLPGGLLFAGTVLFAAATTEGLLSVVSVIATLAPLITVTLALLLLKETLARWQAVGVGLAVLGVVLLAAG